MCGWLVDEEALRAPDVTRGGKGYGRGGEMT